MGRKQQRNNQTGCYACGKKHNTNKTKMHRVARPDGRDGTVHVCQAKVDSYEKV